MSISGKSDFEDFCCMHHTPEEIINKYKIYHGWDILPLKIETEKDLIARYPFLVKMSASDKNGGIVRLSEKSYIDMAEEEHFTYMLETLKRYYRSCKRNKKQFDKEEALRRIVFPSDDRPEKHEIELVERVAEFGEKATIEGVHDPVHDRMRDEWYNMMIEAGWNEIEAYHWVYGWRRCLEKYRGDERNDKRAN